MNRARYFYFLLVGRFISGAGSFFGLIAINLFVLLKTGSPVLMGLSMAVRIMAASVVSPYLGSLSDKINRKRGMIASDAILAVAMIVLALFPEGKWLVVVIFIVQATLGVFNNFFMINFQAALPLLAPKGNLLAANSYFQVVNSITILIGSLGAAVAIDAVGYRWAFAVDGITYLASLLILIFLPVITEEKREAEAPVVKEGFLNGVSFLAKIIPFIFFLFLIRMLDGVGSGSHNIALPIFSEAANSIHPNRVYGLILAVWGLGGFFGVVWVNFFKSSQRLGNEKIFIYSTLLMSLFWIAVFLTQYMFIYLVAAILAGIFDMTATVSYSMILQRTDDAVRGRVMALSAIALTTGFGGGMALASLMAGFLKPPLLVAFWHGIPILFIVFYIIYGFRMNRLPSSLKDAE